jgi:hypothetical protein
MGVRYQNSITIFFGFLFSIHLHAQIHLSLFTDAGKNNVSDGFYMELASCGAFQFQTNTIEVGGQFDVVSNKENRSPGFFLEYSKEFKIYKFPLEAQGFFLYNRFSALLYETNWGIVLESHQKHFVYKLGTNFRTYAHSKKAIEKYEIENHKKIHENFNLMYTLTYFIKPLGHKWNIGLTLTDFDYFIINQETNPVFNLQARYCVTQNLTLFMESWYKSAGALNLSVNPFGFFFRTGVIWEID